VATFDVSYIGDPADQLTITNGGAVLVGGKHHSWRRQRLRWQRDHIAGGSLTVTNAGATGTLQCELWHAHMNGGSLLANTRYK